VTIEDVKGRFAEGWTSWLPYEGWWPLIVEMDEQLAAIDPDIKYYQIKEKFGGLRVYTTQWSPEVIRTIADAGGKSYRTCEYCGASGRLRDLTWVKTLCDEHADRQQEAG
jgi:hypothetical protein